MAGIKYDTGGSEVMTKAIDELINRFPGWTEEEEVVFSFISDNSGVAWYPVSGAVIEREKKTIVGEVRQTCQYPFYVLYRTASTSEHLRINVKEKLDKLGEWLERQEITVSRQNYKLDRYPEIGGRKINSIRRTTPSYNANNYDDGICDWVVYITVQYENNYFE